MWSSNLCADMINEAINPISSENYDRSEMAPGGRKIDLFFSDFEAFWMVFESRNALKRRIYGQKWRKSAAGEPKIGYFGQNPILGFWILSVAKIPSPRVNHRSETRRGIFARNRIDNSPCLQRAEKSKLVWRRRENLTKSVVTNSPENCDIYEKVNINS